MKQADIRKICVLGAGEQGNYIALESALAGYQIQLYDISLVALGRASDIQKQWASAMIRKRWITDQ